MSLLLKIFPSPLERFITANERRMTSWSWSLYWLLLEIRMPNSMCLLPPTNEVTGRWCFQSCLSFFSGWKKDPVQGLSTTPLCTGPQPQTPPPFCAGPRGTFCSLWCTHCWKAGGYHSTEMLFCFNIVFIITYIVTITLARRRHQITQLILPVEHANEEEN